MAEREMPVIDPADSIRKSGNYPSNSYIGKDIEKKKADSENRQINKPKVKAVIKKKSLKRKFYEVFLGDSSKQAVSYIINDVFLPAIKSTFYDMVTGGLQMRLWGDTGQRPRRSGYNYNQNSNIRYNEISNANKKYELSRRARSTHQFNELTFKTRIEAEEVRNDLIDIIDEYDEVTVANLYEILDMDSTASDRDWGWNNLSTATVSYTPDGWIINFPKTIPLK